MIPIGYENAVHGWAISPEITAEDRIARSQMLLAERDALMCGFASGGKGVSTLTNASLNGKSFQWDPGITKAEKLPILHDVLTRLGLVAPGAQAITTTHADFSCLER